MAAVVNTGKQVVSDDSSATVTLVADVALPLKAPLKVVAVTTPVNLPSPTT